MRLSLSPSTSGGIIGLYRGEKREEDVHGKQMATEIVPPFFFSAICALSEICNEGEREN